MKYPIAFSVIFSTGLALFALFFGAGCLMYPVDVGAHAGNSLTAGTLGFLLTTALLPLLGFVSMLLFNGNYQAFFERLGKPIGMLLVVICMVILGPGIVIPRIITLNHLILAPHLPEPLASTGMYGTFLFSLLFLTVTFIITFRQKKILSWLCYLISPLLLVSLASIIIKGILNANTPPALPTKALEAFAYGAQQGYATLNILGALFFAALVMSTLKKTVSLPIRNNALLLAHIAANGCIIGLSILAVLCAGLAALGMYYGHGIMYSNPGALFNTITSHIFSARYAFITATAVTMACLSTTIASSAIVAEYIQRELFEEAINFPMALACVLLASLPLALAGLDRVVSLTQGALTSIGYPVLITLALVNICHKLFGLRSVKLPVFIVFIIASIVYLL